MGYDLGKTGVVGSGVSDEAFHVNCGVYGMQQKK